MGSTPKIDNIGKRPKFKNSKIQNLFTTYFYLLNNDIQLAYFKILVPFHLSTKNLGIQWMALIKFL